MAKVTKAEQIAQFCEGERNKRGIVTVPIPEADFETAYIADEGLFQFSDAANAVVVSASAPLTLSRESAEKLGKRQMKKSMDKFCTAVTFNGWGMENSVWNFMNGKPANFPRVFTCCHKTVPLCAENFPETKQLYPDREVFRDGHLELSMRAGKEEDLLIATEEIPKTGKLTIPLTFRLSSEAPKAPVVFHDTLEPRPIDVSFEIGKDVYSLSIQIRCGNNERTAFTSFGKWRAGTDERGAWLQAMITFTFNGY